MSSGGDNATATLPAPSIAETARGRFVLALTVLFHPDLARIGQRTTAKPGEQQVFRIGRSAPAFAPISGAEGAPLDDPHLSRAPIVVSENEDGGADLDAQNTSTSVMVRGRTVRTASFTLEDIHRGVVLTLANCVVLLLHSVAVTHLDTGNDDCGLIGDSDALRSVLADVRSVAALEKPVLLRGESGSGKELVAAAIHRLSGRRNGPFVAVNMGAIPASIAAAELFGAERGAFTGAVKRRGYFEQAEGGTLFLDEIGEAPPELQAALLRALETSEIQPLGADRSRKIQVRIVAATDADLEAKTGAGSFKAPLLNRLSAYQIWMAPLRERRDDIGRLFVHFLTGERAAAAGDAGRDSGAPGAPSIAPLLVARLAEHNWPGNVRQLRNVVARLFIDSRGREQLTMSPGAEKLMIDSADTPPPKLVSEFPRDAALPDSIAPSRPPPPSRSGAERPRRKPAELEKAEIEQALSQYGWDVAAAARALNVARPSLHLRMKTLGIRTTSDVSADEITAAFRACGGDVAKMAVELQASERALLRRVRELGLLT